MEKRYDVLVLGGGLAGYYSSITLARGGKSVALIEKESLGGTALRWGALPVKKILDSFKKGDEKFLSTWDRDLEVLDNRIKNNLINEGIDIYFGEGEFIDSQSYNVGNTILEGDYIIIATGTEPASIREIPIDGNRIITHKEAIDLSVIPKTMIILGGNVEGVEFAALYAELGVSVTIVEKEDSLLLGNDEDLVFPIENYLKNKGVNIIKGVGAEKAWTEKERVKVILEDGRTIEGDKALVTLLRKPNIPRGVERLNIIVKEDKIVVDENLATNESHVFAIGDINGIMGMGHIAIYQGIQVADYILHNTPVDIKYEELPRAIFTLPEMAGVGKQEWELTLTHKVGYSYFKDTWRGWAKDIEEGFVKVIIDQEEKILGIWMVGENVSEYISLLSILIHNEVMVKDIKSNLIIHPSLAEAILEAVLNA